MVHLVRSGGITDEVHRDRYVEPFIGDDPVRPRIRGPGGVRRRTARDHALLGHVELDGAHAQAAAGATHRPVRTGFVDDLAQTRIGAGTAEHEDIGRLGTAVVTRRRGKHVFLGEPPGKRAGEFEIVENAVAGLQKIGAELLVALEDRAEPAAPLLGERRAESCGRQRDQPLQTLAAQRVGGQP